MADPDSRAGARYATAAVLDFVERTHAPHDAALERAFETPGRLGIPPIQVGVSEGRALGLFLRMVGAKKVVEVGTLAGYSAMWMARELPRDGRLWTLELDPAHAKAATENLAAAGVGDCVEVICGSALEVLPTLTKNGPFDAVFIDADKGSYDKYAEWAAEALRPGGLILVDNAYYFGKLCDESREAAAVRRCHEFVAKHFDSVCLPTPDGLLFGLRRT